MSDRAHSPLPPEYVAVLRDLAREPARTEEIRSMVAGLDGVTGVEAGLIDAVLPLPSTWRPDDHALFCRDRRVRDAELRRRIDAALDEWIESGGWSWRSGGVDAEDHRRIAELTRREFEAELADHRRRHGTGG
ncbi:hypothetical protein QNM97_07590 [Gordonia sp. L191]|uniref:hypothetical protein n=1 Tax=Gordonia TaxID=2053 RepID=UPI001AD68BB9|nr:MULTISPECIES: hypothetical protein [Gordonia]QTI67766.1 hypothetical protein J6U32_19700 [Gordonia polyisoprenivorans]WHU48835.1 hypothetical protein QNM97_07590 [Gordonia sp. L191]